jgi:glycine cleavage system aminomethyltransferase T
LALCARAACTDALGTPHRVAASHAHRTIRHAARHAAVRPPRSPCRPCKLRTRVLLRQTVLPKLKRLDAPAFLGRAALEEQRASGLSKRLVCLVLDDEGAPPLHGGECLVRDGEVVGLVRSAAYGHTLRRIIVTGYADVPEGVARKKPLEWLKRGSWAVTSRRTEMHAATLHTKAPFDPSNARVMGEY